MFVIVDIAGFQEIVSEGMTLKVPLLKKEPEDSVEFEKVLLVADEDDVKIGAPYVKGAVVQAQVLSHGRADKIRIQKAHRRKRYRRVAGHRQNFTEIKIVKIVV